MKDREVACWLVGGILGFVGTLMGGLAYVELVKADARVEVATIVSEGLTNFWEGWPK